MPKGKTGAWTTQPPPLAILGTAVTLPCGIQTREQFFQIIKEKQQVWLPSTGLDIILPIATYF